MNRLDNVLNTYTYSHITLCFFCTLLKITTSLFLSKEHPFLHNSINSSRDILMLIKVPYHFSFSRVGLSKASPSLYTATPSHSHMYTHTVSYSISCYFFLVTLLHYNCSSHIFESLSIITRGHSNRLVAIKTWAQKVLGLEDRLLSMELYIMNYTRYQ